MATIRDTWAAYKPRLFDADEGKTLVSKADVDRTQQHLDKMITKLGAFAVQVDSPEEFALLEQPLKEFQKNYVVFVGTLTAMCGGSRAGRSLRHEIVDFGNAVTDAFAHVEELVVRRDIPGLKAHMATRVGILLEALKGFAKVPKANHTAVKKRLIRKIRELRDACSELKEEMGDGDGDDESQKAQNMRLFVESLEEIEAVLKSAIHGIHSDEVVPTQAMEEFLDTVGQITALTDELCCSFQAFDDDEDMFGDDLDMIEEEDAEGSDEEGKDDEKMEEKAESVALVDELQRLLTTGFRTFADAVRAEGRDEALAKLDGELLPRLKSGIAGA